MAFRLVAVMSRILTTQDEALLFQNLRDGSKAAGWGSLITELVMTEVRSFLKSNIQLPIQRVKLRVDSFKGCSAELSKSS